MSILDNILGVCFGGLVGCMVSLAGVRDNRPVSAAIISLGGLSGYFFITILEQEKEKNLLRNDLEQQRISLSEKVQEIRKLKQDHPRIILGRIVEQQQYIEEASKRREERTKKEKAYLAELQNDFKNSVILPQETLVSELVSEQEVQEISDGTV
jgi:hypothetical protein